MIQRTLEATNFSAYLLDKGIYPGTIGMPLGIFKTVIAHEHDEKVAGDAALIAAAGIDPGEVGERPIVQLVYLRQQQEDVVAGSILGAAIQHCLEHYRAFGVILLDAERYAPYMDPQLRRFAQFLDSKIA